MSSQTSPTTEQDAVLRAGIDRSLRHPVMFFLTSAAAWLAVSLILGIISSAKVHSPGFMDGCSWLTYGRTQAAHVNALLLEAMAKDVCGSIGASAPIFRTPNPLA